MIHTTLVPTALNRKASSISSKGPPMHIFLKNQIISVLLPLVHKFFHRAQNYKLSQIKANKLSKDQFLLNYSRISQQRCHNIIFVVSFGGYVHLHLIIHFSIMLPLDWIENLKRKMKKKIAKCRVPESDSSWETKSTSFDFIKLSGFSFSSFSATPPSELNERIGVMKLLRSPP